MRTNDDLSEYMTQRGIHPVGGYKEPQNLWKNAFYGRTVKNTDVYYDTIHNAWYHVPVHWIGENTLTIDHIIQER